MRRLLVVLLVLSGCGVEEAQREAKERGKKREASHLEDVELTSCGLEAGRMVAGVRVVNGSSERSNYSVEVAFTSLDGTEQLAVGSAFVRALEPGQGADETVRGFEEPAGEFDCEVVDVFRFSDE